MQNLTPKVSVCVTTYNQENYIRECLESIVNQQTSFTFEVLVSDDCSTDDTSIIVQEFSERYPHVVKVIPRSRNLGAFQNFIDTHNQAIGEYVCHCDGDDRFLPGKLQAQVDFLDISQNFTVCWSRANLFDDHGRFRAGTDMPIAFPGGIVEFTEALMIGTVGLHCTVMYRAKARLSRSCEEKRLDLFYSWEFLSQGLGMILPQVLAEYRVSANGSLTTNSQLQVKRLYAAHASYFVQKFPWVRKQIFVFALLNFFADLKNHRDSYKDFARLALATISWVSPQYLYERYKVIKNFMLKIEG